MPSSLLDSGGSALVRPGRAGLRRDPLRGAQGSPAEGRREADAVSWMFNRITSGYRVTTPGDVTTVTLVRTHNGFADFTAGGRTAGGVSAGGQSGVRPCVSGTEILS